MKVVVHFPSRPEDQRELKKKASKVHAEFVINYLRDLKCSDEQKQQLLRTVIDLHKIGGS